MRLTTRLGSDWRVLRLYLIGVANLAAGTVIAVELSSIQESFAFYGQTATTTSVAPIVTVQLPSFVDPKSSYVIGGVFIGVFLTIGFFALLTAFRRRRASKTQRAQMKVDEAVKS